MALTPQNDDTFFREVDDELRRERMTDVWRRYGRLAIATVVIGLVALAGYLWWQSHREQQAGEAGEALSQTLSDLGGGKDAGAIQRLDTLAASSIDGYRGTARLTRAAAAIEKNDDKAAGTQYDLVIKDDGLDPPFRDLALIRKTSLEFDTLPPAEVLARLTPLAVAGNPWFGSAAELSALAYLKMGQTAPAARLYASLARDKSVPETIRARATKIAGALGVDLVMPAAATKG